LLRIYPDPDVSPQKQDLKLSYTESSLFVILNIVVLYIAGYML